MTPEERAKAFLRELDRSMKSPRGDYYQGDIADPHRTRHIAEQHIRDAIAEEREACAQFLIDEEFDNAEVIAAAIRARK